jgi:hypothetical protein
MYPHNLPRLFAPLFGTVHTTDLGPCYGHSWQCLIELISCCC